ncbi:MAG: hypothetical protein V1775_17170 [Bacteroidota bacterium]
MKEVLFVYADLHMLLIKYNKLMKKNSFCPGNNVNILIIKYKQSTYRSPFQRFADNSC